MSGLIPLLWDLIKCLGREENRVLFLKEKVSNYILFYCEQWNVRYELYQENVDHSDC